MVCVLLLLICVLLVTCLLWVLGFVLSAVLVLSLLVCWCLRLGGVAYIFEFCWGCFVLLSWLGVCCDLLSCVCIWFCWCIDSCSSLG